MSKVILNDTTLTSIADAIRNKTGTTDLLLPSAMSSAISNIQTNSGNTNELIMKYAAITPSSNAKVIDLSPWITDANINDWFIIGGFGYWKMSDSGTYLAPKVIGPMFRDFAPTSGTASSLGWSGMGFGHDEGIIPSSPNSVVLQWEYYGGKGWESRMLIWNPTAKTLSTTDTRMVSKMKMFLIYREV